MTNLKFFLLILIILFCSSYVLYAQGIPDRINNLEDAIEELQSAVGGDKLDVVDANVAQSLEKLLDTSL